VADSHRTYLLSLDFARKIITRYVHHRGTWGVRHLRTVTPEPPETMDVLGTPESRAMLEEFRTTGGVK